MDLYSLYSLLVNNVHAEQFVRRELRHGTKAKEVCGQKNA